MLAAPDVVIVLTAFHARWKAVLSVSVMAAETVANSLIARIPSIPVPPVSIIPARSALPAGDIVSTEFEIVAKLPLASQNSAPPWSGILPNAAP